MTTPPPPNVVSIIVPSFNSRKWVCEAIDCALQQTYPHCEVIVVDDGSTDGTGAMVHNRYGDSIRYVHQENKGLPGARNTGLRLARGAFIQFLDADDLLPARKIEHHVRLLRERPDVGIAYSNAYYFRDGAFGQFRRSWRADGPEDDWVAAAWKDERPLLVKLAEKNIMPVCAPLVRRTVVDSVGLFNDDLPACEDWDYWVRCSISGTAFLFQEIVGAESYIRVHADSMTTDARRMHAGECLFRMICHEILPAGAARSFNVARLLRYGYNLESAGREGRYQRMSRACRSARERVMVTVSNRCDPGGALHPLARRLGARFPRFLRHTLIDLGFGFIPSRPR